jgi:hypothetical protein
LSQHTFGALVVGIGAILLGVVWLGGAIGRLRHRGEMRTELGSSASGIYTFALTQVGCGIAIVFAGVVMLALGLFMR